MKKIIINALSYLGIQIKLKKPQFLQPKNKTVKVGKYTLKMDSRNTLAYWLENNTGYSGELGRVAKIIQEKYYDFRAIDIGANIGDTLCIIKNATDVPVICFEGDKYCFDYLKHNTEQFSDITLYCHFLGESTQELYITKEDEGRNTALLNEVPGKNKELLKIHKLDDFLLKDPFISKYKLLKIDTEGYDPKIIRGGLEYIKTTKPIIYFEYNRDCMSKIGEEGIDTLKKLRNIGYDKILFYEAAGRFMLATELTNDIIQDLHDAVDGKNSYIYYWDLIVFHQDDDDLAIRFIMSERDYRINSI